MFLRDSLLDSVANRIKAQMPRPFVGKTIPVADLGGDVNELITKGIRDCLAVQQGSVVPSEFFDRVLRQIGLAGKPVTRLEDALHVARETGVDGVCSATSWIRRSTPNPPT